MGFIGNPFNPKGENEPIAVCDNCGKLLFEIGDIDYEFVERNKKRQLIQTYCSTECRVISRI